MEIKILLGMVSKETSGKLWGCGAIWETHDEANKFIFLCGDCSAKELKGLKPPTELEFEKICDEVEKKIEVIDTDTLEVPKKFKDTLFVEELSWTYRLSPDAIIICESCEKTVI